MFKKKGGELVRARIYSDDITVDDSDKSDAALYHRMVDTSGTADGNAPYLYAPCLVS